MDLHNDRPNLRALAGGIARRGDAAWGTGDSGRPGGLLPRCGMGTTRAQGAAAEIRARYRASHWAVAVRTAAAGAPTSTATGSPVIVWSARCAK